MGTSAPVVREHEIPIETPKAKPLRLPAPDPDTYITPITVPVRQPVVQPMRREQ